MSTPPSKEIVKALLFAVTQVQARAMFICHALEDYDKQHASAVGEWIKETVILPRLGTTSLTYRDWLEKHHPDLVAKYLRDYRTAFTEARLCWLNALIEEFSE